MSTSQLFFGLTGAMITLMIAFAGFFKYYIDAKIDPIAKQVATLVDYMILHEGKIASLQERTKNL
jgi:uncharacterized membrane protein